MQPAKKNKIHSRFAWDRNRVIKKQLNNPDRHDRNQFVLGTKINKTDDWVRIPVKNRDSYDPFIEAATTELYRALGPTNSAPKTRVEVDENGRPLAICSKRIAEYSDGTIEQVLQGNEVHLAQHLAMMYLTGEFDLNLGNVDIIHGKRLDFEYSFIDFIEALPEQGILSTFNHRWLRGLLSLIHPVDLKNFPNLIIAKPRVVLSLSQVHHEHARRLNELMTSPKFKKTIYQYFLKALLFDKNMIAPILAAHMPDGTDRDYKQAFRNYLENRFMVLKTALVQTPEFRQYIRDNFVEYKAKIREEFQDYNKEFERKPEKYADRIVNLQEIEHKLDQLYQTISDCDLVCQGKGATDLNNNKFKAAFNIDFIATNEFHQYAMQMLLVSTDTNFNESNLLNLIKNQVNKISIHLGGYDHYPDESALSAQLNDTYSRIKNTSILKQAEILFYADAGASQQLHKTNMGSESIYESWYHKTQQAVMAKKSAIILNVPVREHIVDTTLVECFQPRYLPADEAGEFEKLEYILNDCLSYGDKIKNSGDVLVATAFMEKVGRLYDVLALGIKNNDKPNEVAKQLIIEINKPDALLGEHRNFFKNMIAKLLAFIRGAPTLVMEANNTVSKPWLLTQREKLLADVVQTVRALPGLRAR